MPANEVSAVLTAIYTLTPTHCGTGQTSGAVDLPIAREPHTEYPIFPASSIKGVLRDSVTQDQDATERWFGPELSRAEADDNKRLRAGDLVVTEARLVLFPVRSLVRPFLYATSAHCIERLARDLDAFGVTGVLPADWQKAVGDGKGARVADADLAKQLLVIEDFVYKKDEVHFDPAVAALSKNLAKLLPEAQTATRSRLEKSLVVLTDGELRDLVTRTMPVQARVKLTSGKTTDKYTNESGKEESGNLWYEETLPADCLMAAFVSQRGQSSGRAEVSSLTAFRKSFGNGGNHQNGRVLQIGGNETVGHGRAWWTLCGEPR